jgi:hypothetical protein
VPWYPYPRLAVPEINAPVINDTDCITYWDFTYADQLLLDFMNATPNVTHIINYSTTPDWMWVLDTPYTYPENASTIDWNYNNGTSLRDPTLKEISDYYSRLLSYYTQGGMTDECGVFHPGYNLTIEAWEILNESEGEHSIDIGLYNQIYDAVTAAIHAVSPNTEFIGLAMESRNVTRIQDFLQPANHQPGTPLDWISYHFYAGPNNSTTQDEATSSFQQADQFFEEVAEIEAARKQIAPNTKTTVDEIGTMDPNGDTTIVPGYTIPAEYWAWSGGVFAYIFSNLTTQGIDVVGESQLSGYPGQYPSVSMIDWNTGLPTARLRALQLLQSSFAPGDNVVATSSNETQLHAQAFDTANGGKKVLLINKTDQNVTVQVQGLRAESMDTVDVSTAGNPWRTEQVSGDSVNLTPYAVSVLSGE